MIMILAFFYYFMNYFPLYVILVAKSMPERKPLTRVDRSWYRTRSLSIRLICGHVPASVCSPWTVYDRIATISAGYYEGALIGRTSCRRELLRIRAEIDSRNLFVDSWAFSVHGRECDDPYGCILCHTPTAAFRANRIVGLTHTMYTLRTCSMAAHVLLLD